MKKQIFLISMLVIFAAEIAALAAFVSDDSDFLREIGRATCRERVFCWV